jgi:hypothetical protein
MNLKHFLLPALLALLLPLSVTAAKNDKDTNFVDTAKQEKFDDQAAAIRKEMQTGGRFEHVNAQERAEVERQLDTIATLLAKRTGEKLDDDDQLDIYAAQETANAILTQRDGRRMICEYSAPTGSNRKVKQCATYAQRMTARKETQMYMKETMLKSPQESCYDPLKC